ncbi:hypothetical protein PHPALM_28433 [Phytophthora palmivora]|uniref:Uncharacterized protein n=1 Tax=Phytophthora palmivora TaxID=4796 RepID=A0A2P4XA82_9STRA|nr:hypothetical protein PHPALM_28433 [Phytophthora palmivora]
MPLAREVFARKSFKLFCQKVVNYSSEESKHRESEESKYLEFPAKSDTAKLGTPVNANGHTLVSGTLAPGTAATDSTVTITTTAEETSRTL